MNPRGKWGYLRETNSAAQNAGIDKSTGLHRTGLEEYLKEIFPETNDWVHNKMVPNLKYNGKTCRCRPDYRSESLKMIVEFDGLPHYTNPKNIIDDTRKTKIYEQAGYNVVRIPYFIQLTNEAVKILFGVCHPKPLFNPIYASLGVSSKNTPAFLCPAGIKRMKKEFSRFPNQRATNIAALQADKNYDLTLWELI